MNTLLTAIVLWLSANFGLPSNYDHPRIEFVPASKIFALRNNIPSDSQPEFEATSGQTGQRETVAVYVDKANTIYLREGWTGHSPAELSVLVHEMVHHLQKKGGLKFECAQEREQLAYAAQERWLGLFGHDLLHDFEIDPFTLLVSTKCMY